MGVMILFALALSFAGPLADRPLNLPRGALELDLAGHYSNWSGTALDSGSVSGEAAAASVAFGVSSGVQLGATLALPINPGFGFGTVAANGLFSLGRDSAFRVDLGWDRLGTNGSGGFVSAGDTYFGGLGAPLRFKLGQGVALVSGRTGGFELAHFINLGASGTGLYYGASTLGFATGDLLTVAHSTGSSSASDSTAINLTVPVGVMLQAADALAFTLWSGYHLSWFSDGATTSAVHFIPLGLDAVFSPAPALDLGASFNLPGRVGGDLKAGYTDLRDVAVWVRFRTL